MRFVLHHFYKEAIYLMPRWLPWLLLLLVDLLVNLEWLMPMNAGDDSAWWLNYLSLSVWVLVFWLIASDSPEDSPGNSNRFLATRPLSKAHYWLSRGLVLIVLCITPLALQEGVYLIASQRPWLEVVHGSLEQGAIAFLLYAWILPFKALWKGKEILAALAALFISGWIILSGKNLLGGELFKFFPTFFYLHHLTCMVGLLVFAVVLTSFMSWNKWPVLAFRLRLSLFTSAMILVMLGVFNLPLLPKSARPFDQEKVDKLAEQLSMSINPERVVFFYWIKDGKPCWATRVFPDFKGLPKSMQLDSHSHAIEVLQDGKERHTDQSIFGVPKIIERYYRTGFDETGGSDKAVAGLFPVGTLLTSSRDRTAYYQGELAVQTLTDPLLDIDEPMTMDVTWALDWQDWQVLAKLPLQVNARAVTKEGKWQILDVQYDRTMNGQPLEGSVNIRLKSQMKRINMVSILPLHEWPESFQTVLYAPDRRIGWILNNEVNIETSRAEFSHLKRDLRQITWEDVLRYKDGSDAQCDPSRLELWIINKRLLGTSLKEWKSPSLRIADLRESNRGRFGFDSGAIYEGNELEVFNQHMASLTVPAADASEAEVRDYVSEVLIRANAISYNLQRTVRDRLREVLLPVAQHHLMVLLNLPSDAYNSQTVIRELIQEHLNDNYSEALIDRLMQEPHLVSLVTKRKWEEKARRIIPELVSLQGRMDDSLQRLLVKFNDSQVNDRLIKEMRTQPSYSIFAALNKQMIPAATLDDVAAEAFGRVSPMLQSYHEEARLLVAVKRGNEQALDLALLWAAMGGETGSGSYGQMPTTLGYGLRDMLGMNSGEKRVSKEKLWPLFRGLRASDFRYIPTEHRWEKINLP